MTAAGIGPVTTTDTIVTFNLSIVYATADTIITFNLSIVYVNNCVVTCVFMILCINDWGRQTLGLQD